MTNTLQRISAVTILLAASARQATAQLAGPGVTGGIDPTTALTNLATWFLVLAGLTIPMICVWKGGHAVAEGRSLGPAIFSAVGGTALCFGGAYVLARAGL